MKGSPAIRVVIQRVVPPAIAVMGLAVILALEVGLPFQGEILLGRKRVIRASAEAMAPLRLSSDCGHPLSFYGGASSSATSLLARRSLCRECTQGPFRRPSAAGNSTCAGLARYETNDRISCSGLFHKSSGIIDCSLAFRCSTSLLGSVSVSLAVMSVIVSLSSARNDAGQHAAVGRRDHVSEIVLADQGARIEDVR